MGPGRLKVASPQSRIGLAQRLGDLGDWTIFYIVDIGVDFEWQSGPRPLCRVIY